MPRSAPAAAPVAKPVAYPVAQPVAGACPKCGASVGLLDVICVNCGHNLKGGRHASARKPEKSAAGSGGGERSNPWGIVRFILIFGVGKVMLNHTTGMVIIPIRRKCAPGGATAFTFGTGMSFKRQ